jgi:hypothetical protein
VIPDVVISPMAFVGVDHNVIFATWEQDFQIPGQDPATTWDLIVRIYTYAASGVAAQNVLDPYLAPTGPVSVKATLEGDQTLGGLVDSVTVRNAYGYGLYTMPDKTQFFGVEWRVRILG